MDTETSAGKKRVDLESRLVQDDDLRQIKEELLKLVERKYAASIAELYDELVDADVDSVICHDNDFLFVGKVDTTGESGYILSSNYVHIFESPTHLRELLEDEYRNGMRRALYFDGSIVCRDMKCDPQLPLKLAIQEPGFVVAYLETLNLKQKPHYILILEDHPELSKPPS